MGVDVFDASVGDGDSAAYVGGVDVGDEGVVGVGFGPEPSGADGGFWGVVDVVGGFPCFWDADGVFPEDGDEWGVGFGGGVGWYPVLGGFVVPYMVSDDVFRVRFGLFVCSPHNHTTLETVCSGFGFVDCCCGGLLSSWSWMVMMALLMVFWVSSCLM